MFSHSVDVRRAAHARFLPYPGKDVLLSRPPSCLLELRGISVEERGEQRQRALLRVLSACAVCTRARRGLTGER